MDKIKNPYLHLKEQGYNCFACAPWNQAGLKMEFYEDGEDVVSFWHPGKDYQGWANSVHGGIQATLIDEVAGWFIMRKMQTAGVTTNLNIRYRKSIPLGDDVEVEVRVRMKEMKRNLAILEGSIRCGGQLCTTAEITYFTVPQETARKEFYFCGCETENE